MTTRKMKALSALLLASLLLPVSAGRIKADDLTSEQYCADVMNIEGWNTYDTDGNPTPEHDTSGFVVAVVDSGVDYRHEDLKDVMWDEGQSYPSLVELGGGKYGICTCRNDTAGNPYDSTDPLDDFEHGTHVAGIVAAQWNGTGVSGVTSGAKIMAVKISNDKGTNSLDEAVRGYEYIIAAKKAGVNVRVINNSWHDYVFGHTMDQLVREAGELGIISVFAAGNDTANIDAKDIMPASFYDNPYAIIVGAETQDGVPSEYSNYGPKCVDLFAPGEKIYSTLPLSKGMPDCNGDVVDLNLSGFHSVQDFGTCTLSMEETDAAGEVLKVTNNNEEDMLLIESDHLGDMTGSAGLGVELYLEEPATVSIMCWDPDTGYEAEPSVSEAAEMGPGLCTASVLFPEDMDLSDLHFGLSVNKGYNGENTEVYIKRVMICRDILSYGFMSGTSMASPAVAGEAITVVSEFPEEPADKLAARIKGSVEQLDTLKDQCVSGGAARLDKALSGDTDPVINDSVNASGTLTISGFFFGNEKGKVLLNGTPYAADAWNDTQITVPIPSDFEPGEYKIEVVSADDRKTCRYDRIGTPSCLFERLSLPGRELSKETGEYTVTSSEFDDTFYNDEIQSLTGLNGSLYAVISTRDSKTAIYQYDIDADTWSMVYHDGHAASGNACVWNDTLLFLAIDEYDNRSYLASFDPAANDVTYHLISEEGSYKNISMISTKKGVFAVGGGAYYHDMLGAENTFTGILYLDEKDMTLKPMTMKNEDINLFLDFPALVYDEDEDILYIIGGRDDREELNAIYKAKLDGTTADVEQIPSDDPIIDNAVFQQGHRLFALSAGDKIVITGRVAADNENHIIADTYLGNFGDTHFEPSDRRISLSCVYSAAAAIYEGKYYVLGMTNYENGQQVFAAASITEL